MDGFGVTSATPEPDLGESRLRGSDVLRLGALGLRARRLRAALSALGIAIGITSMVAVLGLSESSRADLLSALDRLGTNLLTLGPGRSVFGEQAHLPATSTAMLRRVEGVEQAAAIEVLDRVTVRRSPLIAREETGGIFVAAADPEVMTALGATLSRGRFVDGATARVPAVVLGAVAAQRLGVDRVGSLVWLADRWFTVVGTLDPVLLDAQVDRSALLGFPYARARLGADSSPTNVYVRADPDDIARIRALLPWTANPTRPHEVAVSRPSDALAARAAAESAFTGLLLGLGAVALLVGGVGIANVMVVSVLERRSEIGLRRALGATRRHITAQFLTESALLAGLGGVTGVCLGVVVTAAYAAGSGWQVVIPPAALAGGLAVAVVTGVAAGLYPAVRAARLSPTDALRSA
jgi:putative ABC transport system permease protein